MMMNRYEVLGRLVEKIVKEYKKAWDNRGERGEYYDMAPINIYRDPMKDIEEDYDRLFTDIEEEEHGDFEDWASKKRAKVFVEHIQEHLEDDEEVICKICDRSIDEIWEEFLEEKKEEEE